MDKEKAKVKGLELLARAANGAAYLTEVIAGLFSVATDALDKLQASLIEKSTKVEQDPLLSTREESPKSS